MPPKEVFLSHSSVNAAITARLAQTLRNHGIPVWYSATNIIGSQQWQDEIGNALKRCDWFVVLLSEDSVASEWVKRELQYALMHSQYDGKILPVILAPCDPEALSWTLSLFQMIDLSENFESGCTEILKTWGFGLDASKMA